MFYELFFCSNAEQFDSHLRNERDMAAVKIQSHWKSFIQRRNYQSMKVELKQHKAARVIQKAVSLNVFRSLL